MNKFTLLPIFLLLFFSTKAQDRIISINHDTIHCTIVSMNNEPPLARVCDPCQYETVITIAQVADLR